MFLLFTLFGSLKYHKSSSEIETPFNYRTYCKKEGRTNGAAFVFCQDGEITSAFGLGERGYAKPISYANRFWLSLDREIRTPPCSSLSKTRWIGSGQAPVLWSFSCLSCASFSPAPGRCWTALWTPAPWGVMHPSHSPLPLKCPGICERIPGSQNRIWHCRQGFFQK